MYKSNISTARWIAYDIPGNIGWLAFLAGLILCFVKKPELMENPVMFRLLLLDVLCGVVMLIGIGELISERLQKLDRVLPKARLYRGFGALTVGSLAGALLSLTALTVSTTNSLGGGEYLLLLSGGGLLCFLFSGLLLKEYHRA